MRETTIEKKLKTEVEKRGGKALKFTSPGMRGVPDRIILLPGAKTIFVELKAPNKKPDPMQMKMFIMLLELGHRAYVVDSMPCLERFVKEVLDSAV